MPQPSPPKIWMWQRVLLWTLAALHLPILAASIWVAMNAGQIEKELQVESSAHLFQISALLIGSSAILFTILPIKAALMKPNRQAWNLNFGLLIVVALSCVMTAAAAPLLFYWTRPETKEWFGIES